MLKIRCVESLWWIWKLGWKCWKRWIEEKIFHISAKTFDGQRRSTPFKCRICWRVLSRVCAFVYPETIQKVNCSLDVGNRTAVYHMNGKILCNRLWRYLYLWYILKRTVYYYHTLYTYFHYMQELQPSR